VGGELDDRQSPGWLAANPSGAGLVSLRPRRETSEHVSDARTPEEEPLETDDEDERQDEQYSGPGDQAAVPRSSRQLLEVVLLDRS
jgi:hypothetical protein